MLPLQREVGLNMSNRLCVKLFLAMISFYAFVFAGSCTHWLSVKEKLAILGGPWLKTVSAMWIARNFPKTSHPIGVSFASLPWTRPFQLHSRRTALLAPARSDSKVMAC